MEPVTTATNTFLSNGLLGATVVILAVAVIFLYREAQQAKNERLTDWINHNTSITQTVIEIRVFMQRIIDLITQGKKDEL